MLGGLEVRVGNGIARLADGKLAGSTLTLDRAVRNMVSLGFKLEEAVAMASATPAESLSLKPHGVLSLGSPADMVVLDEDMCVVATIVGCVEVFWRRSL